MITAVFTKPFKKAANQNSQGVEYEPKADQPEKLASAPRLQPWNPGLWGTALFLAGQDASNSEGQIVAPGDLIGQFDQVLGNLKSVVEEAGGKPQYIVKINIFVKDRDSYVSRLGELGKVFRSYFGKHYPTMALFEVSAFFHEEALIELEGIVHLPT